jgi:hypothetical protein
MAAEGARARVEAAAHWDAWFAGACDAADGLLGRSDKPPLPGLAGNPLPVAATAAPEPGGESLAQFPLRTVSEVSVSALARALAGPAQGFAPLPRSPFQTPRSG